MDFQAERERWLAGIICGSLRLEGSLRQVYPEISNNLPTNRIVIETTMGKFLVTVNQT